MARPVLPIRKKLSARRIAKVDPAKNVPSVCAALRSIGLYKASDARNAIRAS
jgi:hypothetical protein